MKSIASKAALSLTIDRWRWIHEEAWEDYHRIFAHKCPCFLNQGSERSLVIPLFRNGKVSQWFGGPTSTGRWILLIETEQSQIPVGGAHLQWDHDTYQTAYVTVSLNQTGLLQSLKEDHPLNWLIEALTRALTPDVVILGGDLPPFYVSEFADSLQQVVTPPRNILSFHLPLNLEKSLLLKMSPEVWHQASFLARPQQDLAWVRKRSERERRQEQMAAKPKQRPFLIRVLLAFSPVRRMRRERMIHPLDRYKM